jgi:hypothetical protein
MKTKYILLSHWAKRHGLTYRQAKDSARAGALKKYVNKKAFKIERYVIPEDFDPATIWPWVGEKGNMKKLTRAGHP